MVADEQIRKSKSIQRRTGKTFHVATRLLPERIRHATYVLYAFFRIADEVVDDPGASAPAEQRERLLEIRRAALGETDTDDPVLAAFSELRQRHDIDDEDVNVFIDAMLADIETRRYETYEELETYMDGSAAAVGRMMTAVMDPNDREIALSHATALGEAFQMTNFLRDVREDVVERDRIYIPQSTLQSHDVDASEIERLEMSPEFAAAMRSELRRTEALYQKGVAGIKYLPKDCQFAVLLASVLYVDHHRLIRAREYDVLSSTPQLRLGRKLYLLAKTRWRWAWNNDPETVFREVSTIGDPEPHRHGAGPIERLPTR